MVFMPLVLGSVLALRTEPMACGDGRPGPFSVPKR